MKTIAFFEIHLLEVAHKVNIENYPIGIKTLISIDNDDTFGNLYIVVKDYDDWYECHCLSHYREPWALTKDDTFSVYIPTVKEPF